MILLFSCEKWNTTEEISHISFLPEFEMVGGSFASYVRNDTMEFTDPGVNAFSGDEELTVYAYGQVDLSTVGVYSIRYFARNEDKLIKMDRRLIAVTYEDVSDHDLSGTYEGTNWSLMESKVKKVHKKGLYECEDIMGYEDADMPGSFVDLGNGILLLVDGEGYFGHYAASEGEYTLSTLSWAVHLLDPPNEGVEIPVIWRRKE